MKSKDQFFEKFGKKGGSLILVAMLVVTAGTAATVTHYFTSSGTTTVDTQAISGSGDTSADYTGAAAPATFYNEISVTNNNDDRYVSYQIETLTDDNIADDPNVLREVYRVQEEPLVVSGNPGQDEEVGDETEYSVKVTPNVDEVTYRVNLPENYFEDHTEANADLQISPEDDGSVDNYHVKYSSDSHTSDGKSNWMLYKPSQTKGDLTVQGKRNVLSTEQVRSVDASESESYMEVTVKREVGSEQSFGVSATAGGETTAYHTEGFDYYNQDVTGQKSVDFTDYLESGTLSLAPSETQLYNAGVFLDTDTPSDESYKLELGVSPVTQR